MTAKMAIVNRSVLDSSQCALRDRDSVEAALRAVVETRLVRRLDPSTRIPVTKTPPSMIENVRRRSEEGGYEVPDYKQILN